ncbi:glycoside hydrolase family 2 TIM barrel-domain containing protein [Labilibaculum antarcticum]|uniref:Glycoside hydrolase family 2 n=1 Tax=Labilibaculum antarcticum TaxID=1717717 RepID=A0A1Y1CL41_9BACT|nr:glycoside hydrolase family 2 TIM barrel-domain containing protein [Labilibaculum antarcticum]BAX81087.1 glycoside hydrolase family 2 [Labilibaculum antarcticum]
MKSTFFLTSILLLLFASQNLRAQERETDFNFDWKFTLLEDTKIPEQIPMTDNTWRDVRLPHDWSVEFSFDEKMEGCTGYLAGGVGVYQKHFKTPSDKNQKSTFILFDGVYNNATFWLNGERLGENPYGYSPVYFDLTSFLKENGEENVLTVHVDHSRYADSRWYTGSGIYRNVKLITVDKLHIPIWGTFVTTPQVTADEATVQVETKVVNSRKGNSKFTLSTDIFDAEGKVVASDIKELKLSAGKETKISQAISVIQPNLWDTETPNMYKAVSKLMVNNKVVDKYTTPFGIRSLRFDKDQGFFLNGKSTYVKGVCLHHDGGLVGAAVPKGVWKRRLEKLKEAGCNAIRTSHNPFSEEFLDICDELGFLVQNEIFDEMDNPKDKQHNLNEQSVQYITRGYTEHFQKWGESDLKRTILRDRNHPSVFQWSIGNEIEWTYPGYKHVSGLWDPEVKGGYWNKIPDLTADEMKARYNALPDRKYKLAETAQRLAKWVKEVDTTRAVTANLIIPVASCASGYAGALDVVGFSYQIAQYDWCKKNYPDMMFTGNENSGLLSEWLSIIENPMVFSMYMWTGIDYLGESQDKWPQKGWDGDMLDFAGFEKQGWNYFKSIWVNKPQISLGTLPVVDSEFTVDELSGKPVPKSNKSLQWRNSESNMHWNYSDGEMVLVEVCSNLPVVELFLNGVSLGCRSLSECPDRILRWAVPYQAGTLTAKAGFDGARIKAELKSASAPVGIRLTTDKTTLSADGYDVAHVIAQLVDKDGNEVKISNEKLTFSLDGDATILGVDNGSNKSIQDYQSNELLTSQGRGMLLIQSLKQKGSIVINASADGLKSNRIQIEIK